ncbi:MAG: T9SS C-terminal target domain-containing protein [Bacteroidetes bacterium]|nr:MAG: T9SS C-terminal target domain-containing protein [Bacteroidota bacterium]
MKKYLFLFPAICILQLMALSVSATKPTSVNVNVFGQSIAIDIAGNVYATGAFVAPFLTFTTIEGTKITLANSSTLGADMFIVKYDPSGNVLWAVSAGGSDGDLSYGIATDGTGNVYVAGSFFGPTMTFGNLTLNNTSIAGQADAFIAKYDADGNLLWATSIAGNLEDEIEYIAVDATGIYVTGLFDSPVLNIMNEDGTTFKTLNPYPGATNYDMYVVKYDPNGFALWANSAGGSGYDGGESIATDGDGAVYVIGMFSAPSITFGNTVLTNVGYSDIFIVKYSANEGTVQWATKAGGPSSDHPGKVAVSADGNIYITGFYGNSSLTFFAVPPNPFSITLTNNAPKGDYNMFIVRYDPNGIPLQAKNAKGGISSWTSLATGGGFVYATGAFSSPTIIFGNYTLTNTSRSLDIYIVKYDPSLNVVWAKSAGGKFDEATWDIASNSNGDAFVTGYFASPSLTFGNITLVNTTSTCEDAFIAKYAPDGSVPWAKCLQGSATSGNLKSTNKIANETLTNEISVYPNPTSGKVTLSTGNSQVSISSISVFNMVGKEVLSRQFSVGSQQSAVGSRQTDVDLSSQPKGLYIILIRAGENFYQKKIILE